MAYDYWKEMVEIALDEIGVTLPEEQVTDLSRSMVHAAEMQGEASGSLSIPNPMEAEIRNLNNSHAEELKRANQATDNAMKALYTQLKVNPQVRTITVVDKYGNVEYRSR